MIINFLRTLFQNTSEMSSVKRRVLNITDLKFILVKIQEYILLY